MSVNNMLLPFEHTKSLLENTNEPIRVSTIKDTANKLNKIVRPQGIVIQDTYNNFLFPIRPNPQLDTSKADLPVVFRRYRELYTDFNPDLLPWHYVVEMVGNRYYVFNTRPTDTRFPVDNLTVLKYKHELKSEDSIEFFKNLVYRIDDMIHICIIGDSNLDIYPRKIYTLIGRICVAPMFRNMRIPGSPENRIFDFNLGRKFNIQSIIKFARQ